MTCHLLSEPVSNHCMYRTCRLVLSCWTSALSSFRLTLCGGGGYLCGKSGTVVRVSTACVTSATITTILRTVGAGKASQSLFTAALLLPSLNSAKTHHSLSLLSRCVRVRNSYLRGRSSALSQLVNIVCSLLSTSISTFTCLAVAL